MKALVASKAFRFCIDPIAASSSEYNSGPIVQQVVYNCIENRPRKLCSATIIDSTEYSSTIYFLGVKDNMHFLYMYLYHLQVMLPVALGSTGTVSLE